MIEELPVLPVEFDRNMTAAVQIGVDLAAETHDEGRLVGHRLFFGLPAGSTARGDAARSRATITELAFIPDEVPDGPCVLTLAVPAIGGDAVPSQPIVYPLAP